MSIFEACVLRPCRKVLSDDSIGSSTSIVFKNVFNTSRTFNCVVDNTDFTVSPTQKEVAAKSQVTFNVSFTGTEVSSGKLFIASLLDDDDEEKIAPWVYYVNGTCEERLIEITHFSSFNRFYLRIEYHFIDIYLS